MSYTETSPPPQFAPWVEAAWTLAAEAPLANRVIPDGCMDLIWSGGELRLVGPMTRPLITHLPAGEVVHGLRFRPGGLPALLGLDAPDLLDQTTPFDGALPSKESIALLTRQGAPDPVVSAVVAALRARPEASVADLSGAVALGPRQLRRRVEAAVGYGPKRLARILRVRAVRDAVAARPVARGEWARVAAEHGFSDQAHLAREVGELAGVPPTGL